RTITTLRQPCEALVRADRAAFIDRNCGSRPHTINLLAPHLVRLPGAKSSASARRSSRHQCASASADYTGCGQPRRWADHEIKRPDRLIHTEITSGAPATTRGLRPTCSRRDAFLLDWKST